MALLNPDFEEAGINPGEATHWTLTAVTQRERIAAYGSPPTAYEGFGWLPWLTEFNAYVVALFDQEGHEDFAEGWGVSSYLTDLADAVVVVGDLDDCEAGWANDNYAFDWSAVAEVSAGLGAFTAADFAWHWGELVSEQARYDDHPIEDFIGVWDAPTTI